MWHFGKPDLPVLTNDSYIVRWLKRLAEVWKVTALIPVDTKRL